MDREKFRNAGIDYDDGLRRMIGNEVLYQKFLKKFLKDDNICLMQSSLEQGDTDTAYRAVHTLKGAGATLGLKNLADACDIVCKQIKAEKQNISTQDVYHCYDIVTKVIKEELE